MAYYTYIVQCADGTLYVGHTRDLNARFQRHAARHGARHTAAHGTVQLIYSESHPSEHAAIERERQLKKWSQAKKRALIEGNVEKLRSLSKSRD